MKHPNIIRYHYSWSTPDIDGTEIKDFNGERYLFQWLLYGPICKRNLKEEIERRRKIHHEDIRKWTFQLILAKHYLDQQNIVHLDLRIMMM